MIVAQRLGKYITWPLLVTHLKPEQITQLCTAPRSSPLAAAGLPVVAQLGDPLEREDVGLSGCNMEGPNK